MVRWFGFDEDTYAWMDTLLICFGSFLPSLHGLRTIYIEFRGDKM